MNRPDRFHHSLHRTARGAAAAALLAALAGAFTTVRADDAESGNFIDFTAGGASVNGDSAAYQKRMDLNKNGFGGVDGFYYQKYMANNVTLTAKGHALVGNRDYLVNLKLSKDGVGFLNFGYSTFRTWYDGNGGYFPTSNFFYPPVSNDMYIDRSDVWFAFGLTPETGPQFKFRYDYTTRKGMVNSTSWGDTNLTGGRGTRNVVPSYETIDEHRSIFDATLWQDTEKTDWLLNAHYEADKLDNAVNVHRRPGESANRYLTQDNKAKPDIFNTHGTIETKLNNQLLLTAGAAYFTIDTDFSDSRINGINNQPNNQPQ